MNCPKCGKANPEDTKFCGECGTSLVSNSFSGKPIKPKKKNFGCLAAVIVIILLGVFISIVNSGNKSSTNNPTSSTSATISPEEKAKAVHDEWVKSQFSAWDGSCTSLVNLVKENMNNPKSFEHVETKYLDLETKDQLKTLNDKAEIGDLYVTMKFRGTNSFGAIITSKTDAVLSYKRNTITLLNSNF